MTNRQPRGQSNGGEFAASQNPESNVELDAAPASPYDQFYGFRVKDLKRLLEGLPDDEPLLYWVTSRRDATTYASEYISDAAEVAPEQWMDICDKFGEKTGTRHGPWSELQEVFSESVDEVVPRDDDDEPHTNGMNRDDFSDLYRPITNLRSRGASFEGDNYQMFFPHGEDLDFVRRQSNDCVWSMRRNESNATELVNGYREDAEGYFVTEHPHDEDINIVVSN